MELRIVFKKLWSFRYLILGGSLVFTVAAYFISLSLPINYRTTLNLYVNRRIQEPSDKYYTFDGYYSQQAAERYTQTVVGFLQSRDVLKAAAETATLPTDEVFLKQLSKSVRIREEAPQLISLMVTREKAEESEKLSLSLAKSAIEKLTALNQAGDRALAIEQVSAKPSAEVIKPLPLLNGFIGLLTGLIFFSLLAGFYGYLKE